MVLFLRDVCILLLPPPRVCVFTKNFLLLFQVFSASFRSSSKSYIVLRHSISNEKYTSFYMHQQTTNGENPCKITKATTTTNKVFQDCSAASNTSSAAGSGSPNIAATSFILSSREESASNRDTMRPPPSSTDCLRTQM